MASLTIADVLADGMTLGIEIRHAVTVNLPDAPSDYPVAHAAQEAHRLPLRLKRLALATPLRAT